MADFVSILIAFAAGVAVRQFYKQIWAGVKKLFGKAEADVASKIASRPAPAAKPPAVPKS
jgi:hypothetical protein